MIESRTVRSVEELANEIAAMLDETKSKWWFRGQRDATWNLLPGVRRGYDRQREAFLTNLFYTRARSRCSNCPHEEDWAGWLALMQHYGLPTRLLDWTHSPLIATYFATKYIFDAGPVHGLTDAAVWMIEPCRLNKSQGYLPVFPPLNAGSLVNLLRPAIKGGDTSEYKVLAASPMETDLRMLAQQCAFTVHVMEEPLNSLPDCEKWLRKIVIPAECIADIALQLEVLGIRLADVFPDLQHLAKEITNMHKADDLVDRYGLIDALEGSGQADLAKLIENSHIVFRSSSRGCTFIDALCVEDHDVVVETSQEVLDYIKRQELRQAFEAAVRSSSISTALHINGVKLEARS